MSNYFQPGLKTSYNKTISKPISIPPPFEKQKFSKLNMNKMYSSSIKHPSINSVTKTTFPYDKKIMPINHSKFFTPMSPIKNDKLPSNFQNFNINNFNKIVPNDSLNNPNFKLKIKNSINSNSDKLTSTSLSSQNSTESIKNNFISDFDNNEIYYLLNRKESKNFFNKFNSRSSTKSIGDKANLTMNENTVILTLKIKISKNDYRIFNLKKYDDLFLSLEKFFDINKIKQELIKPVIIKVFAALNKTFWLLNNKIGKKDQEYLYSLYKLYLKNKNSNKKNKIRSVDNNIKINNDKSSSSNDSNNENLKKKLKLKKCNSEKNINKSNSNISSENKTLKKIVKTI